MLLELLSWIGFAFLAVFGTLCLAAGLFYLAELVEEYTVMTKRILLYTHAAVVATQLLLGLFTSVPLFPVTLVGLLAHGAYYSLIRTFPFFDLLSPQFLGSAVLMVLHHYLVFEHFGAVYYPFDQVVSYFTLCVWLIPFALFISLSANENTLPTTLEQAPGQQPKGRAKRQYGLLGMLKFIKAKADEALPTRDHQF